MPANNTSPLPGDQNDELEREALVARRRTQQGGGARTRNARLMMVAAMIAGGVVVMVAAIGPTKALRIFGVTGESEDRTSQIDLNVERPKPDAKQLDFVVPAEPVADAPDPNAELKKKFDELQNKLAEIERKKPQAGVSPTEMQSMLTRYKDEMTKQFEAERAKIDAENARLKEEAAVAEEARRRAEEQAAEEAGRRSEQNKLEQKQRESEGVILDESKLGSGPRAEGETGPLPEDLDQNERFLADASKSVVETSLSESLADPSRMIVQGTIISAVLETAINTELPGNLRAQVMEPVFSFDGKRILMPAGTILIGQFNNEVDIAQKRVLIAWNRAITPEGQSIALGSTGTDKLGRSGTEGNVDNRYRQKFGAAALVSAISAIPNALAGLGRSKSDSGSSGGTTINIGRGSGGGGGGGGQVASDMSSEVAEPAKGILDRYLSLSPVIRIPQGEEIRVFVNRDLLFQ